MGVNNCLKLIAATAVAVLAVLALGGLTFAADAGAGKSVYEKNSCAACHGAKAEGTMGPVLIGMAPDRLVEITRAGTAKGMPGFGEDKIARADMDNLVAYVQSLAPAAPKAPAPASTSSKVESPAPPASTKAESAAPPASAKAESAPARAPAEARVEVQSQSVQAAIPAPAGNVPTEQSSVLLPGEVDANGLTIEQKYVAAVAGIAVLLLLVFAVVLMGPLRLPRPS